MDLNNLKKRLEIFKTSGGSFKSISVDVLKLLMTAWTQFSGTKVAFARSLGLSKMQLGYLLRSAKKVFRSSFDSPFEEVPAPLAPPSGSNAMPLPIEYVFDNKMIRFPSVDQLLDFLRKAS